jgi:hypothetical protein
VAGATACQLQSDCEEEVEYAEPGLLYRERVRVYLGDFVDTSLAVKDVEDANSL